MKVIKGVKGVKWYVVDVLYQSGNDFPDKTEEVYFYFDRMFFSKNFSSKLAAGRIDVKELGSFSVDEKKH